MKVRIEFEDGKSVELSEETTRLRKELIKDDGQLVVDRFRAVKEEDCFVTVALMKYPGDKWDESFTNSSNAKATHLLTYSEIKEIIKGLQKMIGD